jgi:hypothetical protein
MCFMSSQRHTHAQKNLKGIEEQRVRDQVNKVQEVLLLCSQATLWSRCAEDQLVHK